MNVLDRVRDRFQEKRLTKLVLPYTLVFGFRTSEERFGCSSADREGGAYQAMRGLRCSKTVMAERPPSTWATPTRSSLNRTRPADLLDRFKECPTSRRRAKGIVCRGRSAQSHVGQEVGSIDRVKDVLHQVNADITGVRIIPGWFELHLLPSR